MFSLVIPHLVIVRTKNSLRSLCSTTKKIQCTMSSCQSTRERRSRWPPPGNSPCVPARRTLGPTQAHATVHVVKLGLLRVNIHVDRTEGQLILDGSLFQLEDTCGRFLSDKLAMSLKCPRCCGCCCCCCCSCCGCCWCCCCWLQVQHNAQRVAFSSFCLPFLPFLSFSPCDLSRLAHFLRGSCGCSPHLSTVSRRPQVRSIVDSDPPSILPPYHVSVRHVALFMH